MILTPSGKSSCNGKSPVGLHGDPVRVSDEFGGSAIVLSTRMVDIEIWVEDSTNE